jgi:hypothetical protein
MTDREWLNELAGDLGVTPKEVATAIVLLRTGRSDLLTAVVAKRMTICEALTAARKAAAS